MASIVGFDKIKIDDPVGAISVHGVCGIWGIFAVLLSNGDATFTGQLLGTLAIFGWTFVTSLVVWSVIKAVIGIRISEEEELVGSDKTDIGIEAYPEFTKSYLILQVRVPLWANLAEAGCRRRSQTC